jgi:hypothetical protein
MFRASQGDLCSVVFHDLRDAGAQDETGRVVWRLERRLERVHEAFGLVQAGSR